MFSFLILGIALVTSPIKGTNDLNVQIPLNRIIVNKCCEKNEIMDFHHHCLKVKESDVQVWSPIFSDDSGKHNLQIGIIIIMSYLNFNGFYFSNVIT